MTTARERFLERVRNAVREGNHAGLAPGLPARNGVGYQGAGEDPVHCFREACTAAGGVVHLAADRAAAIDKVLALLREKAAQRVLIGRGSFVDPLSLTERCRDAGFDPVIVDSLTRENAREPFFASDVGIDGVDYLIAETGSIVRRAKPEEPRSVSLLPPVHIAIAERSQIVPDLFDLFETHLVTKNGPQLPSCLTLITGPSKTGDIELKLVTGVHGPGEVHVIIVGT